MKRLFLLTLLFAPVALNAMFPTSTPAQQRARWTIDINDAVDMFNKNQLLKSFVLERIINPTDKDWRPLVNLANENFARMIVKIKEIKNRWNSASPQEKENAIAGLMYLIEGLPGDVRSIEAGALYRELTALESGSAQAATEAIEAQAEAAPAAETSPAAAAAAAAR